MSKRFALSEDEEISDNDSISGKPSKMKRKPESMSREEPGQQNILLKILNRERTGYFNNNNVKSNEKIPYKSIPSSLAFCLKDIVPVCYLESHVFMGLTACGQFLISYKRFYGNEETIGYDFSSVYKYELFFWIYSPGKLLSKYYNVCLFDDHSVNYIKFVTMSQWICDSDSRTLIIHGASEIDDTCFVSYVRIPKLGCLDCKQLRDIEMDGNDMRQPLCIQCCLTIHTKYHYNESTQLFNPSINLNCPKYIIMSENSFIHTINVRLDMKKSKSVGSTVINWKYLNRNQTSEKDCINKLNDNDNFINNIRNDNDVPIANTVCDTATKKKQTIVDEILADFSEYDIEYGHHAPSTSTIPTTQPTHVYFQNLDSTSEFASEAENIEELIITCTSRDPRDDQKLKTGKVNTKSELPVKRFLRTSREKSPESNNLTEVAAKTYEFSEDNEKCEKISIFRKRRLADKKYEFSEDNSENIIPFNRMRNKTRNEWPAYKFHGTHTPLSPAVATSHYNYNLYELQSPHSHRASPNHGFRSPCGSPVSNRFLRSPPGFRSPSYRSHMLSPPKTFLRNAGPSSSTVPAAGCDEGHKYFSDIINRIREIRANANFTVEPNHPEPLPDADLKCNDSTTMTGAKSDKPFCSKKIIKYFVEEDDATSVITNEEDDCISPGYHTSLPMEVHGGCYGNMQIISKSNLSKLSCPVVVITQNSFDVEAFTIYVANYLCSKNNKKYGILYDSAYEISHVCPHSQNITCVLMLQFTASDFERVKHCQNCSNTSDCLIHRKLYQSSVLFTWNMSSGEYDVLDYGKLRLSSVRYGRGMSNCGSAGRVQVPLVRKLNKFTKKLFGSDSSAVNLLGDNQYLDHMRILDANEYKTKDSLVDLKNCIEFYRRHPYDTPDSVCSFTLMSGSEDSNISFSSDDEFDEPENVEDRSTDTSATSNIAKALLST